MLGSPVKTDGITESSRGLQGWLRSISHMERILREMVLVVFVVSWDGKQSQTLLGAAHEEWAQSETQGIV